MTLSTTLKSQNKVQYTRMPSLSQCELDLDEGEFVMTCKELNHAQLPKSASHSYL